MGDTVVLDGSASYDLDGDRLTYLWSLESAPQGSSVALTGASLVMPTLTLDVAGTYWVQLIVSDGIAQSEPALVSVSTANVAPVALLQSNYWVSLGETLELSADQSFDVDGDRLSFLWSILEAPQTSTASLSAEQGIETHLTPDVAGEYWVQLIANDGTDDSAPALTKVIASVGDAPNRAPVADAGADQFFAASAAVVLDGSQSYDPDNQVITYQWHLVSLPEGSTATLANANTATPGFTLDEAGLYVVQLVVSDGQLNSAPDTVVIGLQSNLRPVANITAEAEVFFGAPVALDGLDSTDANGDILTYQWAVINAPEDAEITFDNDTDPQPLLSVDSPGDYLVQLIVNDGTLDSVPATHAIRVLDFDPNGDDDGDGLSNAVELLLGLDPFNPDTGNTGVPDGLKDFDDDGLPNLWEVLMGYDPTKPDTSGNGVLDGDESFDGSGIANRVQLAWGSDPRDPTSVPVSFEIEASPVVAGGRLRYVIHVSNMNAPDTLHQGVLNGVTVRLTVPTGVSFSWSTDAEPNASGCSNCSAGNVATWSLGSLAMGESRTIEINATVAASVTPGTLIQTPVSVSATGIDHVINLSRTVPVVASQPVHFTLNPSKDPVAPGESFIYELDLGNSSNTAVTNSDVRLLLPVGLTVDSVSHEGAEDGNTIRWTVSSLAPGATVRRSVRVTLSSDAAVGGTVTAVAQLRHDGGLDLDRELHAAVSISRPLPLSVSYTLLDSPVVAGGRLRYQISVSNVQPEGNVSSVSVLLRVPVGVSFSWSTDAEPNAAGCSNCVAGSEASWSIETLAAGESRTIEINATVAASVTPGSLIQTPLRVGAAGLGDTISLSRTVPVVASQPVHFTLNPSKDPVAPGESFIYELDLSNSSNAAVTNSSLRLHLPAGLTVDSISNGGAEEGNSILWTVSSLAPGAAVRRSVRVTLASEAVVASTLTAVAQLRHDGGLETDRELHASISVSPPLQLAVSYTLLDSPVVAGGRLRYQVTISNIQSEMPVSSVSVLLRVPVGVSFSWSTDAEPNAAGCSNCVAGSEASWTMDTLAAGESRTIEINATVAASVTPGSLIQTPLRVSAPGLRDTINLSRTVPVVASQPVHFTLNPSKDPVTPGESFTYELDLSNSGNTAVANSEIRLFLPAGLTVNSISGSGAEDGNTLLWTLNSLAPGETVRRSVSVTLANDAVLASTLTAVAQLRHDGGLELDRELHASISVSPPLDLGVSYTLLDSPVVAGGRLRYHISMSNLRPVGNVNNVSLLLRVPAGVSFSWSTDAEPNAAGCSNCVAGSEASWSIEPLAAGESRTIEINATVAASVTPGSLIQTSLRVSALGLRDTINLSRTAPVVANQPIHFTLNPSKDPVAPGESFIYALDLSNSSNAAVTNSDVRLRLPAGLTVENISNEGTQEGNAIRWTVSSLASGAAVRRSVRVTLASDAVVASTLTAVAQLRHDGGLEVDRELHATISVSPPLDLDVSYTLLDSPVVAGGRLRYQISVSNVRPVGNVSNISLLLRVPAGVSFSWSTDAEPNAAGCSNCVAGSEASWSIETLASGESRTIEVNATVAASVTPGSLIQTPLRVSASGLRDTINLSRTATVVASQPVHFTLSPSRDPVVPGESFIYEVALGNSSNAAVTNSELRLVLPSGLTVENVSNGGVQEGNSIRWTVSSLASGAAVRRSVSVTLATDTVIASTLTAVAQLRHDGGLELDRELHSSISVLPPLDLGVTYTLLDNSVVSGGRLRYQISVTNVHPVSNVTGISVMLRVPAGVSFSWSTDAEPNAAGCSNCVAGSEASWNIATLAAGETRTIEVNATVAATVASGTLIQTPVRITATDLGDTIHLVRTAAVQVP